MWFALRKNILAMGSLFVLIVIIGMALFAEFIMPYDPLVVDLDAINLAPSPIHIFGTDSQGRDIFSRVILGARYSLLVGFSATFFAVAVGVLLGLIAGYFKGKIDKFIVIITDITMAFPSLLLAIAISVVLKAGLVSVVIAIAAVGWTGFARLVRSMVIEFREADFVASAESLGCSNGRILFKHILPNCYPLIITAASLQIGNFILSEAALSFLGLGVKPPAPTWGAMINVGRDYIYYQPWHVVAPGLFIAATIMAFNLFGEFLRNYLNPKSLKI